MTLSYLASEHPSCFSKVMQMKLTILKELLEETASFTDLSESAQGTSLIPEPFTTNSKLQNAVELAFGCH